MGKWAGEPDRRSPAKDFRWRCRSGGFPFDTLVTDASPH